MTVSSEVSTAGPYNGNGVTVIFPYGFKIVDETHLRVVLIDALGVVSDLSFDDGDYSVSGVGNDAGGNVTVVSAPASGEKLTIVRNPPITQETDLENQGPYSAGVVESRFDLITMQIQKVKEVTDRSLTVEPGQEVPSFSVIAAAQGFAEDALDQAERAEDEADRAEAYANLALNTWGHIAGVGNGVVTDIPLAANPGSVANTIVNFNGILQMKSTYSLVDILGVTNIRFSSPIPDTIPYEIEYGNRTDLPTIPIPDASLTTAKYAPSSVDAAALANDAVTFAKMQNIATQTMLGRNTAGTGDPEALTAAQAQSILLPAGSVIDSKTVRYTANTTLSAVIPLDDTIPQITEGTEIISTTFTMKSVTNILRLRFRGSAANTIASPVMAAIFIAGDANAKAAVYTTCAGANYEVVVDCGIDLVPGVLTALTISVRAGPGAATNMRFNGDPSQRYLGGSMGAVLLIEEIKA